MRDFFMKRAILTAPLLVAVAVLCGACASDTASRANPAQAQAGDKGATYITGSLIPRDVNRHGRITDGSSNVRVLDEKTIQGSGQQDVGSLLNQQGVTH